MGLVRGANEDNPEPSMTDGWLRFDRDANGFGR